MRNRSDRRILAELYAGAIGPTLARRFVVRPKEHRIQIKASSTARSIRAADALARLDALGGADVLFDQGWSWDRIASEVGISSTWLRHHYYSRR